MAVGRGVGLAVCKKMGVEKGGGVVLMRRAGGVVQVLRFHSAKSCVCWGGEKLEPETLRGRGDPGGGDVEGGGRGWAEESPCSKWSRQRCKSA